MPGLKLNAFFVRLLSQTFFSFLFFLNEHEFVVHILVLKGRSADRCETEASGLMCFRAETRLIIVAGSC